MASVTARWVPLVLVSDPSPVGAVPDVLSLVAIQVGTPAETRATDVLPAALAVFLSKPVSTSRFSSFATLATW